MSADLATLAWAVAAAVHDRAEVDRLVAEAVSPAGAQPASEVAQVHCLSGHAYAALGGTARSTQHFEEAARIDPRGNWGRAARAMGGGIGR